MEDRRFARQTPCQNPDVMMSWFNKLYNTKVTKSSDQSCISMTSGFGEPVYLMQLGSNAMQKRSAS